MLGLKLTLHECARQFSGHRWNCSNLDKSIAGKHSLLETGKLQILITGIDIFPSLIHSDTSSGHLIHSCDNILGYKEASFTYALAAAGVLHQIARACSLGKIAACGCETNPVSSDFEWQGCSHDLGFGAKYSRKFLQSQSDENSMQSLMQMHNSKIGRKVSKKEW